MKTTARGRICSGKHGCNSFKSWSAFNRCSNGYNGYRNICRDCMNKQRRRTYDRLPEAEKERRRKRVRVSHKKHGHKYTEKEKETHRAQVLRGHGIDQRIFDDMMRRQHGLCAICRRPSRRKTKKSKEPTRLCIDHDHKTGKVRDLLCCSCNSMIGLAQDDMRVLRLAITYLAKHRRKT